MLLTQEAEAEFESNSRGVCRVKNVMDNEPFTKVNAFYELLTKAYFNYTSFFLRIGQMDIFGHLTGAISFRDFVSKAI